ncbi:SDR family oxidoreductase [Agreia sp.]|uniref:SDR family oxidoreductase n=1 Tax=Agreia sp. TaxID=1872416 RepID=UPI0035BC0073
MAGATGTLGRCVINALHNAGHSSVPLSRNLGVDLLGDHKLRNRLRGATAVIDASEIRSMSTKVSVEHFSTVTRNLLVAGRAAGVTHHVGVSIIGAGFVNSNYYAGKAAQERILRGQRDGWSLLRTTQFHEFAQQIAPQRGLGLITFAPKMRTRPIAAAEVAEELVVIAERGPSKTVRDLAGPYEERLSDMVQRYVALMDQRGPVIEVALPGRLGRGMRDGSLLPVTGTRSGSQTYSEWLELNAVL